MKSYYNEIDAKCCAVLQSRIDEGRLPAGYVDQRSIKDVQPEDVAEYDECHFFAGIGGFPLGFYRAGLSLPDGVRFWTGGFPCQDLSVAGQRAGLAGSRSSLWFEFHRLIASCRPEWVVIENVPGLLSSNGGRDFAILLGGLTGVLPEVPADGWGNAGFARGPFYSVAYRVLDAQFDGVPQRRRRVFLVASSPTARGSCAQVLFERESGAWDPPPSRETGQGAARDVAPCLAASGRGTERTGESRGQDAVVAAPITKSFAKHHGRTAGNNGEANNLIAFDWNVAGSERTRIVRSGEYAQIRVGGVDAVAFQPRYYTRDNKPGGKPSDTADITNCHKAGDSTPHVVAIRNSGRDADMRPGRQGTTTQDDVMFSLQAEQQHAIAFDRTRGTASGEVAAPLRACGAATEGVNDAKADAQCVAFAQNTRDEVRLQGGDGQISRTIAAEPGMKQTTYVAFQPRYARNGRGAPDEVAAPLTAEAGKTGKGDSAQCVAFDWQSGGDVRHNVNEHHTSALSSSQTPANGGGWGVRRLTPKEACRLQGLPDDWVDGEGQSDSAKYRQLGNAVCEPVVRWIGQRIVMVEKGELG